MKKLFLIIISILLIFSLCACGANTSKNPNISEDDSGDQAELPNEEIVDEEPSDVIDSASSSNYTKDSTKGFKAYSDAYLAFSDYVTELKSKNDETLYYPTNLVITPEAHLLEYMTPLLYWQETLDDNELAAKDTVISLLTRGKNRKSVDVQKESANSYITTIETTKGEEIFVQVDYQPDIDALRLVAESNGELAMIFEYVKLADGYAAQYYYNTIIGGTYNAPTRAMCIYRAIISGNEGSCARFDDAEEPASLLDGVPDEQTFIEGATHWFTLKNDEFTGKLGDTSF
ncbi:MAG: hypothetical protein WAO24_03305 [Peptococcia bacterium]